MLPPRKIDIASEDAQDVNKIQFNKAEKIE